MRGRCCRFVTRAGAAVLLGVTLIAGRAPALKAAAGASNPAGSGGTDVVVNGPLGARIDDYLTRLAPFGYSGVMLVVKDGEIVLRKGYGLANRRTEAPNTPETVFDIGSLAKQFTAAAVLMLELDGKLRVEDPISRYLSGVPADKQDITIDQLLTHTSGMDADFPLVDPYGEYYEDVNREDAIRRILEVPLIDAPGNAFAYSNIGYVLLAAIVETVSGTPFREFLRTRIFEPCGMRETGFWGAQLPAVPDSQIARCYDETHETGNPRAWSDSTWLDLGGGEVVSTAGDLYRWQQALASGAILPEAARARMLTPRLEDYGYAWFIKKTSRGTTLVQHGGDYFGFGSQLSWFKDEDVVEIDLSNHSNQFFGVRHVADRLVPQMIFGAKELHMYDGDAFELPPATVPIGADLLQKLPGTYRLDTGGTLVIRAAEAGLEIGGVGQDAVDAIAGAPDAALKTRARLSVLAGRIMNRVASGDTSAFRAEWLRPGAPLEEYNRVILNSLASITREMGPLKEIKVLGTVPGAYPVGILKTVVQLVCERKNYEIQFNWVNERIIGTSGGSSLLAVTPLRMGVGAGPVGWSIIWFQRFDLSYRVSKTGGEAVSITLRRGNRRVTARRT